MPTDQTTTPTVSEAAAAIDDIARTLEAVRYTTGLGAKQMERIAKAKAAAAALRAMPEAQGWRPIESAPKDGATILVFSPERCGNCPPNASGISNARWNGSFWTSGRLIGGMDIRFTHEPTHWMPLPAPPPQEVK